MLHLLDTLPGAPGPLPAVRRPVPGSGFVTGPRSITDPAEPWETPVLKKDQYKIDQRLVGRPFRPTRPADLPGSSRPGLEAVCGPLPYDRLYVIPSATRLVTRTQCVITPAKVLGFGEQTVAIWVDDGPDDRVLAHPIDQLVAVDDRQILLYGRLRLVAADGQIVVRYNTVSRDDLTGRLIELRQRMAKRELAVEPGFLWLDRTSETKGQAELPHKWRVVLDNATVRPNLDEPAIIAAGDVSEIRRGRTRPASGVAVLGRKELVVANEPSEYLDRARYGVDLLAVPRERLASLSWDGKYLTVGVAKGRVGEGGSSIVLPLDPYLVDAMRRAFGSAVVWV